MSYQENYVFSRRLAGEYDQIMDIPVRYFKDLGSADKERIFSLNCIECYELTNL